MRKQSNDTVVPGHSPGQSFLPFLLCPQQALSESKATKCTAVHAKIHTWQKSKQLTCPQNISWDTSCRDAIFSINQNIEGFCDSCFLQNEKHLPTFFNSKKIWTKKLQHSLLSPPTFAHWHLTIYMHLWWTVNLHWQRKEKCVRKVTDYFQTFLVYGHKNTTATTKQNKAIPNTNLLKSHLKAHGGDLEVTTLRKLRSSKS